MSVAESRESVTSSRSKTKSFDECYRSYCKSKNISPMRNLMKNNECTLDFCVDKIKYAQWEPILISIGEDISLECLSIRCRTPTKQILENIDSEIKAKGVLKSPVILTRFMLWKFMDAVSQCISQTPLLNILQIEGLPLPEPYIDLLVEALNSNSSLKYIGLNGCQIGDSGCQKVCTVLRNVTSVISLNLSGCNITPKGMTHIVDMINYIKIMRYSENWQHTLRYQSPDLDSMKSLRRISLSDNPEIGDTGLCLLLNVLLDDLWIKAVDLQHCGVTDNILKDILKLLENNTCIQILDLRYNQQMSMKAYGTIMTELRRNECPSAKYSAWYMMANHPIFKNNQKICSQKPNNIIKDKMGRTHYTTTSVVKYDSGEPHVESIHVHILKEQLKNEIAMRKKLEELNVKLLQQVKELKANQIANWKAHVRDKSVDVSDNCDKVINKKREIITIDLTNDQVDSAENKPDIKTKNEPVAQKKSHHINLMGCSGINLLESLMEQKGYEGEDTGANYDSEYLSELDVLSDSSEDTTLSGSTNSTVKCVRTK